MRGDDNEVPRPRSTPRWRGSWSRRSATVVRAPLHSLLGFLELLDTIDLEDDVHSIVSEARGGGTELLVASDRLLILLRLLIGDQPAPPQSFSTADLLRDVARSAGPEGAVWTDVNPYLPATLAGDLEDLRQLLVELVSNAVRHGGHETRVYAERIGDFTESPGPGPVHRGRRRSGTARRGAPAAVHPPGATRRGSHGDGAVPGQYAWRVDSAPP